MRYGSGRSSGNAESIVPMFDIKQGYRHNLDNDFFNDTDSEDGWQREVYASAAEITSQMGAQTVYDIGCGSAYKLVKYFSDVRTVGFDLEPTVSFLKEKYPDREWRISNFEDTIEETVDVVICADVIEHIPDPDRLMEFLAGINFRKLFLSTPERLLIYGFDQSGPPLNPAHCREWTMVELRKYASNWFIVESHGISNKAQATQLIVCRPKP